MPISTRRMSFEESLREVPKHFAAGGDLVQSHLAASLSAVFPDGEDYFVRSVRNFRDVVEDPQLKREVAGFIGQEAMHGREHRALNDRLAALGYPTKRFERFTAKGLALRERVAPPISNLAATAALEHFTATLAEALLEDESLRDAFGVEEVRDLFLWHALEELEHKSVAFDVYRAAGGSERMRIWTMKLTRIGFVAGMSLQIVVSLLGDRRTYKRGELRRSWKQLKTSPLVSPEIWRRLKEYDRKGFHPTDRDTTALESDWRERLFGADGRLNDRLAGRSAA